MLKKHFSLAVIGSVIVQYLLISSAHSAVLNIQPSSVSAKAWLIYDPQTQQIISEHNSHQRRAPASLTKMLVAYIVLQDIKAGKLNTQQQITVSKIVEQVQDDESQLKLKVGDKISIDELLKGLIVMSANDSALLLAEHLGQGKIENFVQRMNEEAKKLNMNDSHFANPSGISMANHYSTAHDLKLLSLALLEHTPEYLNYSKLPYVDYNKQRYPATNLLLERDKKVDGLKTGYTKDAGYNLALSAMQINPVNDQPRRLVFVVLGTPSIEQRAKITHQLLNLSYEYTKNVELIAQNQFLTAIDTPNAPSATYQVFAPKSYIYTASLLNHEKPIDLRQFDLNAMRLIDAENKSTIPLNQPQLTYQVIAQRGEIKTVFNKKDYPIADIVIYQNGALKETITVQQDIKISQKSLWQKITEWFQVNLNLA